MEEPIGDYPKVVTQSSGNKVLVVQDYAFGKYLGYLKVTFDDSGNVKSWSGNPILLDSSVEKGMFVVRCLCVRVCVCVLPTQLPDQVLLLERLQIWANFVSGCKQRNSQLHNRKNH